MLILAHLQIVRAGTECMCFEPYLILSVLFYDRNVGNTALAYRRNKECSDVVNSTGTRLSYLLGRQLKEASPSVNAGRVDEEVTWPLSCCPSFAKYTYLRYHLRRPTSAALKLQRSAYVGFRGVKGYICALVIFRIPPSRVDQVFPDQAVASPTRKGKRKAGSFVVS